MKHEIKEKHTLSISGIYDSEKCAVLIEDEVKLLKDLFQSFNNKEIKLSIANVDEID